MKKLLTLILTLSAQAYACDLNFLLAGVCGTVRWGQGPVLRTESTLDIEFAPAVDMATVYIDAWMPAMGHGTRPVKLTANADGSINVSKLFFTMPGTWVLRVRLPLAEDESGNLVELVELPITL